MWGATQLVLLICLSGALAQGESQGIRESLIEGQRTEATTITPEIWTELKELRNMVWEQRVELSVAKTELQCQKNKVEDLERENAGNVSV